MTDIENRDDIYRVVSSFYIKVRKEKVLGPIFNAIIHNWDEHLNRLTDFWETNLFAIKKFKGNPTHIHQEVDHKVNHIIKQEHFGTWLNLWFQTIDELYKGDRAETAKRRAQKMATFLFIKIFEARNYPKN